MMFKILFVSSFLILNTFMLNAQSDSPKRVKGQRSSSNSLYIGILGPTIPGSLNFEHIWTKNGIINIGTKIGGFYSKFPKFDELTLANGSFEFTFLFGRSKHVFDMGIGWAGHYGSYYSTKDSLRKHYGVPTSTFSMHYRYQPPNGGLFFKVGFTGNSILLFASSDVEELLVGNTILYAYNKLSGENPSFTLLSIGIGYSFPK